MALFDRFKRSRKDSESSGPTEDSFDLDDDALFGTADEVDSGGDDAFGSLGELGDDDSGGAFATVEDSGADPGAAATADFDDFGDLGGSLGGEDLGEEFSGGYGDEALDIEEEPVGAPAKGKKKGKKPRAARRPGGRKALLVTLGAVVVGLGVGFLVGPLVKSAITGEGKLRAEIQATVTKLQGVRQELAPLKRAMSPEEMQAMQAELATRQAQMQIVADIDAKVADQPEREAERERVILARDTAAEALAVRKATLRNIEKQADQIRSRVTYLTEQRDRFEAETIAYDERVRHLIGRLPVNYAQSATADATRTLSVQGRPESGARSP